MLQPAKCYADTPGLRGGGTAEPSVVPQQVAALVVGVEGPSYYRMSMKTGIFLDCTLRPKRAPVVVFAQPLPRTRLERELQLGR
jgi:hypothetical protein